ncbi:hypothetical protein EMIHUDRAFT_225414 [Emiliania huxleyi CCMP1516]|uniref:Uncharacterized protein n=2 Tax=Emiliania huxleyi TaxID=2903 RepID=A0A0D3KP49_EMIH1|nr:hypothetical protein EMIHUDRAFT_225414 [Emiliania huxleyi CCMP1516]EOD37534.1 hypothetical protein EMIHUDRAFT_225414 [Emiliania huxleyi CCMP1516]|eukprot:XP_005789963.1 hypothetical protein EMIHUDRAFT_225414 [Emiliania huxleyi CCMP1516]
MPGILRRTRVNLEITLRPPGETREFPEWSTKHPLFSLEISGNAKCWGPSVFLSVCRKSLFRPSLGHRSGSGRAPLGQRLRQRRLVVSSPSTAERLACTRFSGKQKGKQNPVSAEDARGPGLECQDCFENFYKEYDVEPWLWRRAMREGWSELGGWSREEMEAAEEEMRRGEGSDAYGLQISQLGEWVCDACLEGYLGGGVGDYSELRSGYRIRVTPG